MENYEREHIEKVRALSPECMVLLKSDGSFPLAGTVIRPFSEKEYGVMI